MADVGSVSVLVDLNTSKAVSQLQAFTSKKYKLGFDNQFSGPLKAITGDIQTFDTSLTKATNRVVAFGAAAAVFKGAQAAFGAFAKATIEVEDSLTKINVNLGESADGLKKFSADLFDVARQTGQSFETAAKAAEEFSRQGLSAEETIKRTRDALILSRIAAIDSADAVNDLTAAVNSYAKEALSTTDILNKFVALDTRFAVSSKDLADGLQRAGSVAADAGVSLDKFLGIITAVKQTTGRDGAIIGNALKTIFERTKSKETTDSLEQLGVATRDLAGELLPVDKILQNLAATYDTLSKSQQQQVSKQVANIQQINIFKALLGDLTKTYSVTAEAAKISGEATDEALQKNIKLNQTLKSQLQATKTSVTQFFAALGNQNLSGGAKFFIGLFDDARKYLSGESGDEIGKQFGDGLLKGISNVITGPGFIVLATALGKAFSKVVSTIGGDIKSAFGLNSIAAQRAEVQERINNLVKQGTQAEIDQLKASTTLLQQKRAILAIEERIAGLSGSSSLVNSFIGTTRGGGTRIEGFGGNKGTKIPNVAYVPNMNDGVTKAIQREMAAGVPKHLIYVDKDKRVAGPDNPQGLVVANRRDEPVGGFQGVNRVLSEGADPKKAGIVGNFALSENAQRNLGVGGYNQPNPSIIAGNLDISNISADVSARRVREQIKKILTESLDLSKGDIKGAVKTQFNKLLKDVLTIKNEDIQKIASEQRASTLASLPQRPNIAAALAAGRASGVREVPLPDEGPSTAPQGVKQSELQRMGRESIRRARQRSIPFRQSFGADADQYDSPIGPSYARSRLDEVRESAQRADETRKRLRALVGERQAKQFAAARESFLGEPVSIFGSRKGDTKRLSGLGIDAAGEAGQTILRDRNLQRAQRRGNFSLGASLALPIAAGFVPEGQGGTIKGQALGAASGALNGAGAGAIFGPQGAAIGAALGALYGAVSKSSKSLEEFAAEIDRAAAVQSKAIDATSRVRGINSEIKDIQADGGDPKAIARLRAQRSETIGSVEDPKIRELLTKAGDDDDKVTKILDDVSSTLKEIQTKGALNQQIRSNQSDSVETQIGRALAAPQRLLGKAGSIATFGLSNVADAAANGFSIGGKRISNGLIGEGKTTDVAESASQERALTRTILSALNDKNVKGINLKAINQGEGSEQDIKTLTDAFTSLGAQIDVTTDNYRENAAAVNNAVIAFGKIKKATEAAASDPRSRGFGRNVLSNNPNLETFTNAALVGRNPRSSRGDRGESTVNFFEELKRNGLIQEDLDKNDQFKKAQASTQFKRASEIGASFVEANNPSITGLRDSRGDVRAGAVQSALTGIAQGSNKDQAEKALILLGIMAKGIETLAREGVAPLGGRLGNVGGGDKAESGLRVGANYGAFAATLKGPKNALSITDVRRNADALAAATGRDYYTSDSIAAQAKKNQRAVTGLSLRQQQPIVPAVGGTGPLPAQDKSIVDFKTFADYAASFQKSSEITASALANASLKISVDVQTATGGGSQSAGSYTADEIKRALTMLFDKIVGVDNKVAQLSGKPNPPTTYTGPGGIQYPAGP